MEILEREGINFQLNLDDFTASVIESPNAFGSIVIPHHLRYRRQNFNVTIIKSNAFDQNTIDSIIFAKNSEVTTFEDEAFQNSSIKLIQIPPKLKILEDRCFFLLKDLVVFDVSPKNNLFSFYNNELLIGKSDENQSTFDIVYFARSDLTEVVIPSSIKLIKRYAFSESTDLLSIKFEEDSQLEHIEGWVLCENLKKLEIPKNLKSTEKDAFRYASSLEDIQISPENRVYSWINNTFIVRKEDGNDHIAFCRRNVTGVQIPKNIKGIDAYAFTKCEKLESITFEEGSTLEVINDDAFEDIKGPKNLIIPSSVKFVSSYAFSCVVNLESIQFLSEEIEIESNCFYCSENLTKISFPNAKKIIFNDSFEEATKIYIREDAEISGLFIDNNPNHIERIKEIVEKPKAKPANNQQLNSTNPEQKGQVNEKAPTTTNPEPVNDSKCCLLV
ncbi:hypothetical protein M9Y10_030195 [Tritrichomonas musculus]|uniref:Leucine-rich repeat domain-containing protein n=1 Tax=Tritrichomonas musculus TaxID=1915356 RepID=A0ABR2KPA4_9EUKA